MNEEHEACPHCGASLPWARDAFCSECGSPLDAASRPVPVGQPLASGNTPAAEPDLAALRAFLPFNAIGLVIVAVSFLPVLGVCRLIGEERTGVVLAIGGPVALALDLRYRLRFSGGDLVLPSRGGKFLWLPLWGFGPFWFAYGLWQTLAGAA